MVKTIEVDVSHWEEALCAILGRQHLFSKLLVATYVC